MSTTVNYKGSIIATLDNETKTLTTAGTWLEDDIEIVDESSGSANVYQDEDGYVVLDKSGTASQGESNSWHRPSEWMPYVNGWMEEEAIYYVYDLLTNDENQAIPDFCCLSAKNAYTIQGGYVDSSGTYTVEETYDMADNAKSTIFLPTWNKTTANERYYIIKVKPRGNTHIIQIGFSYPDDATLQTKVAGAKSNANFAHLQPCVEIYGRLPYLTNGNYSYCFRNRYVVHINLQNLISLTNLQNFFYDCFGLQKIDGMETWDTSNVTSLNSTFNNCRSLKDITGLRNWNVEKVTNAANLFSYTTLIGEIDLSKWNFSSVTNINEMFRAVRAYKIVLPKGITKTVASGNLFYDCNCLKELDFNTSEIQMNSSGFRSCHLLKNIDFSKLHVVSTTKLESTFNSNYFLEKIDFTGVDTSTLVSISDLVSGCNSLKEADFTDCDFSAITNTNQNMFAYCYSLERLKGFVYYKSFKISDSNIMSAANLEEVLTNLPTISTTQTITLGTTNTNKLTAEQIAIATGKGWTVA